MYILQIIIAMYMYLAIHSYMYVPHFLGICAFYRMHCVIEEFLECVPFYSAQSRNLSPFTLRTINYASYIDIAYACV